MLPRISSFKIQPIIIYSIEKKILFILYLVEQCHKNRKLSPYCTLLPNFQKIGVAFPVKNAVLNKLKNLSKCW